MRGMSVCRMSTKVGPFLLKDLNIDSSVSILILSNNLLYNSCSFAWESMHLGKNSSSKIAYIEQKITFSYV